MAFDLTDHGVQAPQVLRNLAPSLLYEEAIRFDRGASIAENGALLAESRANAGT